MRRQVIQGSSNVAEAGYDPEEMKMEIKFHNGNTYEYYPVTLEGWKAFMRAKSKGKFFAENFRKNSKINYRRVDNLQSDAK